MRVAVLGAGAIGAYVGAALARGGTDVHLVARGENLEALRRHGVRVHSPRGDFEAHPPATDDSRDIGPVDVVFLGLKANSYETCGPLLEPLLHEKTATLITGDAIFNVLGVRYSPRPLCTDFRLTRRTAHVLGDLEYEGVAFTHGPEILDGGRTAVRRFLAKAVDRKTPE